MSGIKPYGTQIEREDKLSPVLIPYCRHHPLSVMGPSRFDFHQAKAVTQTHARGRPCPLVHPSEAGVIGGGVSCSPLRSELVPGSEKGRLLGTTSSCPFKGACRWFWGVKPWVLCLFPNVPSFAVLLQDKMGLDGVHGQGKPVAASGSLGSRLKDVNGRAMVYSPRGQRSKLGSPKSRCHGPVLPPNSC